MDSFLSRLGCIIGVSIAILLVGVVVAVLIAEHGSFPIFASILMGDFILFVQVLPWFILVVLVGIAAFFVLRGILIRPDQYGAYHRSLFGKNTPYAPLTPVTPKVAGSTSVAELKLNVPRLSQLIIDRTLMKEETGELQMLRYFGQDELPRYGQWPGVIGVSGMQNVGKSVTLVTLAIIALWQGAKVVVCDTHHMKARSLYKKLQALDGRIIFARTEKEVLAEAQNFSQELNERKTGKEPIPYVFILDEAASVIRSDIGEEITTVIEESSQEGHGFNMHVVLAIHDFSQDGIGDAKIRSLLNFIYCHRMQAGQSKFIEAFKGRYGKNKTVNVIAALPQGHVMTRDEVNAIEYGVMPNADSSDVLIARQELMRIQGPASYRQLSDRSGIHSTHKTRVIMGSYDPSSEMNPPTEPPDRHEDPGMQVASYEASYEASSETSDEVQVSREDAAMMAQALIELREEKPYEQITRKDLMEKCGWTRYKWKVVKTYCDERHLLMNEVNT